MASLKTQRATSTVTSPSFYKMVALMVGGYIVSIAVTGWMRDNVVDIGTPGGDAVYGIVAAFLMLMLPVGRKNARSLALGSAFGSGLTIYQEVLA